MPLALAGSHELPMSEASIGAVASVPGGLVLPMLQGLERLRTAIVQAMVSLQLQTSALPTAISRPMRLGSPELPMNFLSLLNRLRRRRARAASSRHSSST